MSDKKYVVVEAEWLQQHLDCSPDGCGHYETCIADGRCIERVIKSSNGKIKPLTPEMEMAGEMVELLVKADSIVYDAEVCFGESIESKKFRTSIKLLLSTLGGSHEN